MYPTKKLSEIAKVYTGGPAPQDNGYFQDGKYPFLRTSDLGMFGRTKNLDCVRDYINEKCIEETRPIFAKKGAIVFPKSGASILTNNRGILGFDCYIVSHLAVLDSGNEITNNYLYNYLLKIDLVDYCENPAYPSLKLSKIKDIEIPLPSLSTQSRIVARLDSAFASINEQISLFRANITDVENMRKCALGEIFHTPEMEEFNKKMGDFVEFTGGSQPPKEEFVYEEIEGYVRLIQIRDYKSDKHKVYVSRNSVTKFCTKDDIMVGRYGPPIFQILRGIDGAYNVALMKAKFDKDIIFPNYLYWFLNNPKIQEYIISLSQRAAGQTGVNKTALETYLIPLPPLPRQHEIVAHLDRVSADTEALREEYETQIRDLETLRQSLLEEAFAGRLVPEIEA